MKLGTILASTPGARLDALVADDARLRRPLPLTRRISFLSPAGGSGCSTATLSVARVYAARRGTPQLIVDASGSGAALRRQLGIDDAAWAAWDRHNEVRRAPQRMSEAFDGLPHVGKKLFLLDVKQTATQGIQPTIAQWAEGVEAASRFPDIMLSDLGVRRPVEVQLAGQRSHVVCVVTRAERHAVDEGACLVRLLRRDGAPAVLCVTDLFGHAPRAALATLAKDLDTGVVVVPREPARLRGAIAPTAWRSGTHAALLELAAALIDADTPTELAR